MVLRISDFSPKRHLNPLMLLVIVMLFVNLATNPTIGWIFDFIFSIFAIYILSSAPKRVVIVGVKWVIGIACFFSILAILQLIIVLFVPSLSQYAQIAIQDDKIMAIVPGVQEPVGEVDINPLMLLGFLTTERLSILGLELSRMRSFTSEPSLLVIYFIFPASLGFFLKKRIWLILSGIILLFCLLSFSGSVQACLVFALGYITLSYYFRLPIKFLFIYIPILIIGILLYMLVNNGIDFLLNIDAKLGNSDSFDFLAHGNSVVIRAEGLINAFYEARVSPFGSSKLRTLPTSIILNTALAAGWLGVVLILTFFYRIILLLHHIKIENFNNYFYLLGSALFFGITCTVFIFNDYAMLNYSGLVLLFFFFRLVSIVSSNSKINE
jgi:hypothetical protein